MKILIIGNSLVEGVGAKPGCGWAYKFRDAYPGHSFLISGIGGDTIHKILNRVDSVSNNAVDIVILETGLNDSRYRPSLGSYEVLPEDFLAGIREFIVRFSGAGAKVLIMGITAVDESRTNPYKEDKFYTNANVKLFDEIIQEACSAYSAIYISMPRFESSSSLLSDGLHPSEKGHLLIFKAVDSVFREI